MTDRYAGPPLDFTEAVAEQVYLIFDTDYDHARVPWSDLASADKGDDEGFAEVATRWCEVARPIAHALLERLALETERSPNDPAMPDMAGPYLVAAWLRGQVL